MARPGPYPGMPRWVKVSIAAVVALIALAAIALVTGLGGPHGPGRHLPSADDGQAAAADQPR